MEDQISAPPPKYKRATWFFKIVGYSRVSDHIAGSCGGCSSLSKESAAMIWICIVLCNFQNYEAYFDLYRGNANINANAIAKQSLANVFQFSNSVSHDFFLF